MKAEGWVELRAEASECGVLPEDGDSMRLAKARVRRRSRWFLLVEVS